MTAQLLRTPSGQALFDSDTISPHLLTTLLAGGLSNCSHPLPGKAGRGGVRIILTEPTRPWVWRHNRRGGWFGRFIYDSYLWFGARHTRAFREWRLLRHLLELGLPVPIPVAAVYERRGLIYRCDLITQLLTDTESLGARLRAAPVPLSLWAAVGSCIRRFHAHGIYHADLNVENILLTPEDQVFLIDFDRGAVREPGPWVESNWSRLRRSIDKLARQVPADRFGPAEWQALRFG
jgi:3-deoxy-D-manno-octulosonic acid kinase